MAEAIFGLVGVIVGGVITTGTQLYFEARRARAARRLAARRLWTALMLWRSSLRALLAGESALAALAPPDPVQQAWREGQPALVKLARDEWIAIEMALLMTTTRTYDDPRDLPPTDRESLELASAQIDRALEVLSAYDKPSLPRRLWRFIRRRRR